MFESWATPLWMDVPKLESKRSDVSGACSVRVQEEDIREGTAESFFHTAMLRTCSIFVNLRRVLTVNVGRKPKPPAKTNLSASRIARASNRSSTGSKMCRWKSLKNLASWLLKAAGAC